MKNARIEIVGDVKELLEELSAGKAVSYIDMGWPKDRFEAALRDCRRLGLEVRGERMSLRKDYPAPIRYEKSSLHELGLLTAECPYHFGDGLLASKASMRFECEVCHVSGYASWHLEEEGVGVVILYPFGYSRFPGLLYASLSRDDDDWSSLPKQVVPAGIYH